MDTKVYTKSEVDAMEKQRKHNFDHTLSLLVQRQNPYPEDLYAMAINCRNEDYRTILHYLKMAAKAGHRQAQHELGRTYHLGHLKCPINYTLAAVHYKAAMEQGCIDSMRVMAHFYNCGMGVNEDEQTALFYYRLLAEDYNCKEAQNSLGMIFKAKKDLKRAEYWLQKACQQGQHQCRSTLIYMGIEPCKIKFEDNNNRRR